MQLLEWLPVATVFYKALLPTASFNVQYQSVFHSSVLALFPSPCHPSLCVCLFCSALLCQCSAATSYSCFNAWRSVEKKNTTVDFLCGYGAEKRAGWDANQPFTIRTRRHAVEAPSAIKCIKSVRHEQFYVLWVSADWSSHETPLLKTGLQTFPSVFFFLSLEFIKRINNIQDQDLYFHDPYLTRFFSSFLEEIKEESKKLR